MRDRHATFPSCHKFIIPVGSEMASSPSTTSNSMRTRPKTMMWSFFSYRKIFVSIFSLIYFLTSKTGLRGQHLMTGAILGVNCHCLWLLLFCNESPGKGEEMEEKKEYPVHFPHTDLFFFFKQFFCLNNVERLLPVVLSTVVPTPPDPEAFPSHLKWKSTFTMVEVTIITMDIFLRSCFQSTGNEWNPHLLLYILLL